MAHENLNEWQLLGRAAAALRKVESLPVGSTARAIAWAVYEGYKAELDQRAAAELERLGLFGGTGGQ